MEQRVLKENELVMLSDDLGDIPQTRRRLGLYYRDTRYLSIFELLPTPVWTLAENFQQLKSDRQ